MRAQIMSRLFFHRFLLNSRQTILKIFFSKLKIFSKLKQILNLNSKIRQFLCNFRAKIASFPPKLPKLMEFFPKLKDLFSKLKNSPNAFVGDVQKPVKKKPEVGGKWFLSLHSSALTLTLLYDLVTV